MTLLTDPAMPTRLGNSNSRDTTPDLTMCKNCQEVEWHNTLENLGSDHYILCTTIHTDQIRKKIGVAKITNWHAFRKSLEQRLTASDITNLSDWCDEIRRQKERYSKEITRSSNAPEVDSHLLHLWEARRSLTKR